MISKSNSNHMDSESVSLNIKKRWHQAIVIYLVVLVCIPANIYRFKVHLPFDLEPNRMVMMLILVLLLAALLVDSSVKFHFTYIHGLLLVSLFTVFLSFTINSNEIESLGEFWQIVNRLAYFASFTINVYVVSVIYTNNANDIDRVFKIIAIIGLLVSIFSIIERFTTFSIFRHLHEIIPILENNKTGAVHERRGGSIRIWGSSEHPIAFASLMTLIVPLAMYSIHNTINKYKRMIYIVATLAVIVVSFLTVSRTALIGLITQAIYFMAIQKNGSNRLKIIVAMVIVFFGIYIVFPNVLSTFGTMLSPEYFQEREIENSYGRYADYPKIIEMFTFRPAFGFGYGSFNSQENFYVDNQYLRLLVEIGAIGLGALLLFYLSIVKELWEIQKSRFGMERDLANTIIASLLSFMVMSGLYDSFGFPQATYLFFALIGFGVALLQHEQTAQVGIS